jgi:nucleoid-associated protein YgaU
VADYEQSFEQRMFDPPIYEMRRERAMAMAVVIPGRFSNRHLGNQQLGYQSRLSQLYARRRLAVLLTLAAIMLVLFVGTGHVVANRGGAPASASAIRPATSVYVVQSGDTLWSIGERFHGRASLADYVDQLISVNGGTHIQPSQALTLP